MISLKVVEGLGFCKRKLNIIEEKIVWLEMLTRLGPDRQGRSVHDKCGSEGKRKSVGLGLVGPGQGQVAGVLWSQRETLNLRKMIQISWEAESLSACNPRTFYNGYTLVICGQSLWLLIMRSRVRFPALPWESSLKGRIPAVTMVWVG